MDVFLVESKFWPCTDRKEVPSVILTVMMSTAGDTWLITVPFADELVEDGLSFFKYI
jgi:hypothetical protein